LSDRAFREGILDASTGVRTRGVLLCRKRTRRGRCRAVAPAARARGCTLRQIMKFDGGTCASSRRVAMRMASIRESEVRRNSYITISFVIGAARKTFTTGS
jgi:hypothetical protein